MDGQMNEQELCENCKLAAPTSPSCSTSAHGASSCAVRCCCWCGSERGNWRRRVYGCWRCSGRPSGNVCSEVCLLNVCQMFLIISVSPWGMQTPLELIAISLSCICLSFCFVFVLKPLSFCFVSVLKPLSFSMCLVFLVAFFSL